MSGTTQSNPAAGSSQPAANPITSGPPGATNPPAALAAAAANPNPTPSSNTSNPIKPNKPQLFSGRKDDYEGWLMTLMLYINSYPNATNDDKINTALMYFDMQKGGSTFAIHMYRKYFDTVQVKWNTTWNQFLGEMNFQFEDTNIARNAQMKLETLRQNGRPFHTFINEFELLMIRAGYDKKDPHLILLLERNVDTHLIDSVYRRDALPTDIVDWIKVLAQLDEMHRRRQYFMQSQRGYMPRQQQTPPQRQNAPQTQYQAPRGAPPQYQQQTPQQAPTYTAVQTGTGTTFMGRGQPMDLDRACLKCGAKRSEKGTCGSPWHKPNQTPRVQCTREVEVDWASASSDQKEGLAEQICRYAAADPEGFKAMGFGFGTA
ncbi:hypothetical protein NM688_g397 [Phlebia brevispora]|uniref:Uncharacterized protein n=1 Tax=Phlebia brevispora TaxID=194682 RepID=A0ACC1TEH0_9APHY|nr:hypothetical protein NM688_g397 [Phlebia brevispora]